LRYGIVREASYLPSPEWQRGMLEELGCDVIQQLSGEDFVTDRRIGHVLFQLNAGDEIVVYNLAVLARAMLQTVRVLRNLVELDVVIVVAPNAREIHKITARDSALEVLAFLTEQDHHRYAEVALSDRRRVQGGSHNPLSKYQIEHARKLYAQGASLRSIGLLFQASPNDVWSAIAPQGVIQRTRVRTRP